MFRKPLMNRIKHQIATMKEGLKKKGNKKRYMLIESIKRKYSLLSFLDNLHDNRVDIKVLEKEFRTKLSG